MSISTGVAARKQRFGGNDVGRATAPRAQLKLEHVGHYVNRPGIMGGKTRAQKIAARDAAKRKG